MACRKMLGLVGLLGLAGMALAAEDLGLNNDEAVYREALDDLSHGDNQRAISKLDALVTRMPSHVGALLDLAIAYCQSATPDKAGPLFDRLSQLPQLPPAIGELIFYYRANCLPTAPPWRGYVAIGVGRANNFNQSPGTDYFYLGSLGVALQLAKTAWPRDDNFRIVEATVYRQSSESGWGGGVAFQGINYRRSDDYDSSFVQANIAYRYKTEGAVQLEAQAYFGQFLLGGKSYLTSQALILSSMRSLSADGQWQFGGVGSVTYLNYLDLPEYRARIVEERMRLKWLPGYRLNVQGELGWNHDQAMSNRPGGDKNGPVSQLIVQWEYLPGQLLELVNRSAWLADKDPYSPAFFGDEKRRSHLSSWYAAWRYQLPENFTVRLEARRGVNDDTIPLFDYRSPSFGVLLEWRPK